MPGSIDLMTVAVIFFAGLVAIGVTLWMLNRAWGDFPGKASRLPSSPPTRSQPPSGPPAQVWEYAPPNDDEVPPELPAGAPEAELIPITQPGVRRAVLQALERGGSPYATYFLSDGDQVYFAAYRVADPVQRAQLVRVFQSLNGGELSGVSPFDLLQTIARLGK